LIFKAQLYYTDKDFRIRSRQNLSRTTHF